MSTFELKSPKHPELSEEDSQHWPQEHDHSDICSLSFSPEQQCLAIGCFNGDVYIRSVATSRIMYRIRAARVESPISSIFWHPTSKNSFICSSANGHIMAFHMETGQLLWDINENENNINSISISPQGSEMVSVGSDFSVRIYSIYSKQLITTMASKNYIQGQVTGHQNRIFAATYIDQTTLATAGWDDTIIIWDTRNSSIVRTISGPHVCGEAMVSFDGKVVTGSYRNHDQIQLYDIGTGNCIKSLTVKPLADSFNVNVLKFNKDSNLVVAGSSGANSISFFTPDLFQVFQTDSLDSSVTALDLTNSRITYGLSNSTVNVQDYVYKH